MAAFFDHLWGGQRGIVRYAVGVNGSFNSKGTYGIKWSERSSDWPGERQQLIDDALRDSKHEDVFVRVSLRSVNSGRQGFGLGSGYIWADLDDVTETTLKKLDGLLSRGSMLVHSGQPGHLHSYLRLDAVYPPDEIEELNQLLRQYLGGDSKYAENTALRVPGTFNHKGAADGGDPYAVTLELVDSDIPPWSPRDLQRLLATKVRPWSRTHSSRPANREAQRNRRPAEIVPVGPEPFDISHLSAEIRRRIEFVQSKTKTGDHSRSGQLFGLVAQMMKEGHSDGQVMYLALFHQPGQEKWANQDVLAREVQRCINKLRLLHDHVGHSCREARCPSLGNPGLLPRLDELEHHFYAHHSNTRTLGNDVKMFTALTKLARSIGSMEFDLSHRHLADVAGVAKGTADRGIRQFQQLGYLKRLNLRNGDPVRKGAGPISNRAYRYRLTHPGDRSDPHSKQEDKYSNNKTMWKCGSTSDTFDVGDDISRWRGLGNARLTHGVLKAGLTSPDEIADVLGYVEQTIRHHLAKLERVGLAEMKLDGSWVARERQPDEVAEELGVLGDGKQQQDQHAKESRRFRARLRELGNDLEGWRQAQIDAGRVECRPGLWAPQRLAHSRGVTRSAR